MNAQGGVCEYTALMNACWRGHLETVKILVSNGANVNLTNIYGETALKIAAHHKNYNIGAELLTPPIKSFATMLQC